MIATAGVAYGGWTVAGGLGTALVAAGGGAVALRLEWLRVDAWRDTRDVRAGEHLHGPRLTMGAVGAASLQLSVAWLRDERGEGVWAFGIGAGL